MAARDTKDDGAPDPVRPDAGASDKVGEVARRVGLRAGAFIVTLYGDVVEPRGGTLATANIVDTCQAVGISETLVRTAVSRLVAAGQIAGERLGRRSFYRLTEPARREFLGAARIVFEAEPGRWCLAWTGPDGPDDGAEELLRSGYARIGPRWFLGACRAGDAPSGTRTFPFDPALSGSDLLAFVEAHWDLPAIGAGHERFLSVFEPVRDGLPGTDLSDADALHLRLLLVHAYRQEALRHAPLPPGALPAGWSGHRARALFVSLYLRLSAGADRHVARCFQSGDGPLPGRPGLVSRRLARLSAEARESGA